MKKLFKRIFYPGKSTYNHQYISDVFISKELIRKYLPDNPVIIDCGAHIGSDTIELAKISGSQVFAFEAVEKIFQELVLNTKEFENITCFHIALSDKDGESDFYVSSGVSDGSSSLLKPKEHLKDHPNVLFNEVVRVKTQKLDTWAIENGVGNVDLLWLDMQGAEQAMLSASKNIFKTVSTVHTEVSTRETYEGVHTYSDFKAFMMQNNFEVIAEAIPANYDMGNVLFVKKNNKVNIH